MHKSCDPVTQVSAVKCTLRLLAGVSVSALEVAVGTVRSIQILE